jgi:hypothetical protein
MLPLSTRHGPADPTEATTRTVHEHEIDGGPISIAGITDSGRWLRARMESAPVRVLTAALALVGKSVLVLATVVCLLSIGGAMLFAFPVLVPLHWLAARNSGPVGAGGWAAAPCSSCGHERTASPARPLPECHQARRGPVDDGASEQVFSGGRYWSRTSGLCRVKAALYR